MLLSFFFLLWGEQSRQESRGLVVDVCPYCRELRPFLVEEHFVATHLYYVNIGKGRPVGTSRRCFYCGFQDLCDVSLYAELLPAEAAETHGLDFGLAKTNPRLHATWQSLIAPEGNAYRQDAQWQGDPVEECRELTRRSLLSGADVSEICERLARWPQLDSDAQSELRGEIRGMWRVLGKPAATEQTAAPQPVARVPLGPADFPESWSLGKVLSLAVTTGRRTRRVWYFQFAFWIAFAVCAVLLTLALWALLLILE